jgi:Bacterial Ig-like domain (group 2)
MRRLVVVFLWLVACSAPTTPNESKTGLRVRPSNATILVGQSVALSAATLDEFGDSIGVASVTWKSSSPSVASVSNAGVATGLAAGLAIIVAKTSKGATDSATILVNASGCYNVLRAPHLHGQIDFLYTYDTTLDSVTYHMHDNTATDFEVDSQPGVDPTGHKLWIGSDTGLAMVSDKRTDLRTGQVEQINGNGHLYVSGINFSHVIVSMDTASCAFTIEAVPYVDLTETPTPGDLGPAWFGWVRTAPTPIDTAVPADTSDFPLDTGVVSVILPVHSVNWLGANYFSSNGWYVPLGFSTDYFSAGAPDDGSAGRAAVYYFLRRGGAQSTGSAVRRAKRLAHMR